MKKWIIGSIAALVITVGALVSTVGAQTFSANDNSTIAQEQVSNGSAFLAGSTINVAGRVEGDLYCAGENVAISGTVTGDVLCAGQTVTISGTIEGDVRAAAQTLTVSGTVGKSATLVGQLVTLESSGRIGQDLVATAQNVTVNGLVVRDAVLTGATTTINSKVERNVTATAEKLTLTNQALIAGNLNYTSPQKLTANDGAQIAGQTVYTPYKEHESTYNQGFNAFGAVLGSVLFIITALLLVLLFPRIFQSITAPTVASPSQALLATLVGLVACIVIPVVAFGFMITVVAIPFILITLLAWTLIVVLSGFFATYYLGRIAWRKQTNVVVAMLTGAVIVAFLLLIPIVNVLVILLGAWYGSGVVLLQIKRRWATPRYTIAPETTKKRATK